ncbi:ubiquitin-specific protease ubp2 [Tulasnella sp. JGI-2019a]|nr:ubiquitin-specific protease ubp2 [Tulasnella sp. JGI-2019a]
MSPSSMKENDKPKRKSQSPEASTSTKGLHRQPPVPPPAAFLDHQLPPPSVPPRRAGSMHTKVVQYPPPPGPPPTKPLQPSPPAYSMTDSDIILEDYREPEPVANSPPSSVPELVDATQDLQWSDVQPSWGDVRHPQDWGQQSNIRSTQDYTAWGGQMDGQWLPLDNSDHWWECDRADANKNPGPGVVPPGLAVRLHPSRHGTSTEDQNVIWRVSVSPLVHYTVDEKLGEPTAKQPSTEQVLRAIPHPHALFRELDNSWVYYEFKQSLNLPKNMVPRPPYSDSATPSSSSSSEKAKSLPSSEQRKECINCLEWKERGRWDRYKEFRTHHFHHYPKSVRGSELDPPFVRSLSLPASSAVSPGGGVPEQDEVWLDVWACCQCHAHVVCSGAEGDAGIVPGVIGSRVMRKFLHEKFSNPVLERSPLESVLFALETLSKILENYLFGLNRSAVKIGTTLQNKVGWNDNVKQLFKDLGFECTPYVSQSPAVTTFPQGVQDLVASHQRMRQSSLSSSSAAAAAAAAPPVLPLPPQPIQAYTSKLTPPNTPDTLTIQKMLRAWVEITIRCAAWKRRYQHALGEYRTNHKLWVSIEIAGEDVLKQIGAHSSQLRTLHGVITDTARETERIAWLQLGLTAEAHTPELLEYAYLRQTQCDPTNTPVYLTNLHEIRQWAHRVHNIATIHSLDELIAKERSQKRWTLEELEGAQKLLEIPREFDNEQLNKIFSVKVRIIFEQVEAEKKKTNSNRLGEQEVAMVQVALQNLKEAYRILAESTGKNSVYQAYLESASIVSFNQEPAPFVPPEMDLQTASRTLEIPLDFDDDMVVTMYNIRVEDQPNEVDRMKRALAAFAKERKSERLARLADSGLDDWQGERTDAERVDWPRGILQLGNTCYLNSLLQYFYTIRELREAILATPELAVADAVSEEEMKKRRVGGRLITRREVERSKKFVSLLKELFWQLEWSTDPAIRPELELAKLALVTSKDEEEDEEGRSDGTNATTSTGATGETQATVQSGSTLVDEPDAVKDLQAPMANVDDATVPPDPLQAPIAPSNPPVPVKGVASPSSYEHRRHSMMMDLDTEKTQEVHMLIQGPRRATIAPDGDGDANMGSSQLTQVQDDKEEGIVPPLSEKPPPPPLPPRKKATAADGGVMMFGKQHDVSECMDNCMFQIEAALGLDKSAPTGDADTLKMSDTKSSIVKKLFYGKIRQRISPLPNSSSSSSIPQHTSSIHEKEDLFSQLLVNVADEGYDLYDGLSGQFDDIIEFGGNQARMETSLVELPPMLQIQLQRVQFNRETLEAYKSNAYVKFGESLFVDRFLSTVNPEKKAKSKEIESNLKACRERLSVLAKQKGGPYDRAINNTIDIFCKQTLLTIDVADANLMNDLKFEVERLEKELQDCRAQAAALKEELENLWQDEREVEYELCSVFIHRGASPAFGHYFFYARDLPDNPDRFIKYNDQDVVPVSKSEVLADTTGSTANPYLLVFARKGSNVVQTINRTNVEALEMDTT